METIKTEIILSDLDIIQKNWKREKIIKWKEIKILETKLIQLSDGKEAKINNLEEEKFLSSIGLLIIKPKIIVCNVD